MKKLLLIDGNSMLFRAYYATVYSQSMSSNSGVPTNAIYGFALMLQKALKVIEPTHLLVAFDHGKDTYRHKEYPEYKGTRSKTPDDLVIQFPIIREYLDALHVVHYEQEGLEADDIIGCLAKQSKDYDVNVLTSDKDLLQLVDPDVKVWLMHKGVTDIVQMDEAAVWDRYTLKPVQIIDLKGLAGDPSDNIPGVTKVGDKTAIKLLSQYETVEGVYEHIDELKGKLKENLVNDKEKAFMSKHLATIITDEKVDVDLADCAYQQEGEDAYSFYIKYDMSTLANKVDLSKAAESHHQQEKTKAFVESRHNITTAVNPADLTDYTAIAFDKENNAVALTNEKTAVSLTLEEFLNSPVIRQFLQSEKIKVVYDVKSWHHLGLENNFQFNGKTVDLMIMAFLADSSIKKIADLFNKYHLQMVESKDDQMSLFDMDAVDYSKVNGQADRLYYLYPTVIKELKEKDMLSLYYDVELPVAKILADMEDTGICCNEEILDGIAKTTSEKMAVHEQAIWQMAGKQFNVNSPKQLAEVIYDDLKLAKGTKRSTDVKVLNKLVDTHPIINEILEYRKYAKLYSTYAFGLKKYIQADGKIHTVYNQCITETGRLSSSDPNLQNISVRDEESSYIRAAFVPEEGCCLVGADYSQVELRMLAHMAGEENLIEAFKEGMDIHTKTAMDIFGVDQQHVTALMRRQAKTINFGIDYGMSAYGLSERLNISVSQAKQFIDEYYRQYPKIKEYMDSTIEFCSQHGYVTTILNRRREIPEIKSSNRNLKEFGKRAAMNAPIQGSAADLMKAAMINVYNKLQEKNLKSKMILQIHDEIILNVPLEEREEVMELVETEMENAMQLSVPLVAKSTSGSNWMEVK